MIDFTAYLYLLFNTRRVYLKIWGTDAFGWLNLFNLCHFF